MFELCAKVKTIMGKYGYPWFIAGGWAIDLYLGRETRKHDDIEIGIFRKDQMKLYRYFENNKKYFIDNTSRIGKKEKKVWNKEYLRLPIHEIYVEHSGIEIEVLLNEKDEEAWIYRRNPKVVFDIKQVIRISDDRIPYLSPEIVILYKTKDIREKDRVDLSNVISKMDKKQRKWLIESIESEEIKEEIRNLTIAST